MGPARIKMRSFLSTAMSFTGDLLSFSSLAACKSSGVATTPISVLSGA